MNNNVKKWVFTFGLDSPLKKHCFIIKGDQESARKKIEKMMESGWCEQYDLENFSPEKYGLKRIEI